MPPNSENNTIETPSPAEAMDATSTNSRPSDNNKCIVKYRKNYYDITKFLRKHPGGVNTLRGLENSDMTARFMRAPPHSDAAMYLMKEYQIKNVAPKNGRRLTQDIKENIEIVEEASGDKHNNNALDDSMEVSTLHTYIE